MDVCGRNPGVKVIHLKLQINVSIKTGHTAGLQMHLTTRPVFNIVVNLIGFIYSLTDYLMFLSIYQITHCRMTGQFIYNDMSGVTAENHETLAQLVSEQTLQSWTPPQ